MLIRQGQHFGLQNEFASDKEIHDQIRILMALPFFKPENIPAAFAEFKACVTDSKVMELYDWFERYYVTGTTVNGKHIPPLFPPKLWSIYHLLERHLPRSDNAAEAYHRRINRICDKQHQSVSALIEILKGNCPLRTSIKVTSISNIRFQTFS